MGRRVRPTRWGSGKLTRGSRNRYAGTDSPGTARGFSFATDVTALSAGWIEDIMPKEPKPMGRPPKPGATRHTIRVTDEVWQIYERIGGGDATRGIELVAAQMQALSQILVPVIMPAETPHGGLS